ncbi:MAG: hypothetical protein M1828_007528 [Chrysothrix sp. TS-e1954]|nr:MAG: hypothetical protein M1828_007528 [Chrysothrix sp. TS-e1954]
MKFHSNLLTLLLTLILALSLTVAAKAPAQQAIMVTFPAETSDGVVADARGALEKAGGVVTHEFQLIKGFAAKASKKAMGMLKAFEEDGAVVEGDEMVTTQD